YEHQINQLIGRVYTPILRQPAPGVKTDLFTHLQVGSVDDLLNNRLDIRKAAFEAQANFSDVNAARLSFLPTVALSPYLGLQSFHFDKLFDVGKSTAYGLLGGITMPLFNQRELKSNYEVMKATYGIGFAEYEKTVLNAVNEVSLALHTQEALADREHLIQQQVSALEASSAAAEELFIAGRVSYLDIINVQKGIIQSQVSQVTVAKEKLLNQLFLYKALGGGWK